MGSDQVLLFPSAKTNSFDNASAPKMKIHAICLVKNDSDIIAHCLESALKWADTVFVYDNGSSDGTWEIASSLASNRIIPWKSDPKQFREGLRSEVFNAFRNNASDGDWWCRLDADEFYTIQDPRAFLESVPNRFHVVWGIMVEYYLTKNNLLNINFDLPAEKVLPLIRSYKAAFSEPRFFRHRNGLSWGIDQSWPRHLGVVFKERIPYRHYKYRSPKQIQTRLETRQGAIAGGFEGWESAKADSWQMKISDGTGLDIDYGNDHLRIDQSILPRHRPPLLRRLSQMLLHKAGIWA